MSLSIKTEFIKNLDKFTWGKDWRAMRIIKERRVKGEYYFAHIIRFYGENSDNQDYDIGDTYGESAWLGRIEKFVGKRVRQLDHDLPDFGKRISLPAITEIITEKDDKGKTSEREILIEGKAIYEYTIPVNKENTEKMKKLAGAIALNQETQFLFIYGPSPPLVVDPETFWKTSVSDYLEHIQPIKKQNGPKT